MKISFVIPAYNEETQIAKCLISVIKAIDKKFQDFEIIVVNNASIDNTAPIARSFEHVKVVDEPVKGLSRARQAGFLASTGDLIANIDADTLPTSEWINKVMTEFSKNPSLVALSGPYIYYDLSTTYNFFIRIFYYLGFISYLFNRFIFRSSSMLQGGNYVVRREALEKIGGFDPKFTFYGEDTDTARKLHEVGDVKFTFDLPMNTSGRRIAEEGLLTMGMRYSINHFWTIFLKRPFSLSVVEHSQEPRSKNNLK
ncbi:MAG TPA: glycosyltransferase family 2 protein [Patescibacteria group bacterium]